MGLIVLHSGHFSKIFKRLMGTSCDLKWREADERERLWVVDPAHPIAEGIGESFDPRRTRRCTASISTSRRLTSWSSSAGSRAARCSAVAAAISRGRGRDLLLPPRPRDATRPTTIRTCAGSSPTRRAGPAHRWATHRHLAGGRHSNHSADRQAAAAGAGAAAARRRRAIRRERQPGHCKRQPERLIHRFHRSIRRGRG